MKGLFLPAVIVSGLLSAAAARGQYKAPRDYFPKNNPVPDVNANGAQPPNRNAPTNQPPAKPQQPKFKDLPVNTQFYFLADSNRAFTWVKVSSTTATNVKNGVVQPINGEVPVQK
jgi:hypothetical protein